MREYLKRLPKEIQDLIFLAGDIATKNNISAYLVGGFVRDLILGVKNLDLDIVVEGDGIKFAENLAMRLKVGLIRHRRFGTATIVISRNLKLDIATTRKEFYPQPASLPEVSPGALKDDLLRRDFTINAMAIDINGKNFGQLIDLFGGKDDLRCKKIRILHDLSFIDDPTRILRAIRFEKRFNFKIEVKTLKFLKTSVKLKILEKVSPHRLRDELILILKESKPVKQLKRLRELTGFSFINPHLSLSRKTYRLLESIEDEINWFREVYSWRRQLDTWIIYFMGFIDSLDIGRVKSICKKYAFTKGEEKRIIDFKKINRKFTQDLGSAKIRPARIFRLLEPLSYEVIIMIKAKYKNPNIHRCIKDFFDIYNGMRLHIRGDDLRKLGIAPGPFYQKIFTRVLNAKLNGLIKTREQELGLIRQLVKFR